MCGLFAVIPTLAVSAEFSQKLRFLVRSLAKENDIRGGHSWGLWSYDYQPYRGLGRIADNMEDVVMFTDTCWKPKKLGWIAGHTRYGTHGAKTVENSHPFVHGDLTLAHNGVVTVTSTDPEVKAHPVDSGQLAIAISKYGLEEALHNTSGMCGLLFSDAYRKLYAYRSDQMLHIAECPWGYAISSDKRHLMTCLEFCGFFDYAITEFKESMVSAPWYPEFEPTEIKCKVRPAYVYTPTTYPTTACGTRWWEREDAYEGRTYKNGVWSDKKGSSGKGACAGGPTSDYEIKLANGIIKTVKRSEAAGTLAEDLETMDLRDADIPPLDYIDDIPETDPVGKAIELQEFLDDIKGDSIKEFTSGEGTSYIYDPNGGCDNCGVPCDEDGGFFFDKEFPNVPLSFCSDCLKDMKIQGYTSAR